MINQDLLGVGQPGHSGLRSAMLALRSLPMFEGLDDDGVLLLAEHGHRESYADREVIVEEGAPPRSVYVVLEGEIVVSRNGEQITLRRPGDAYGTLPHLAGTGSTLAIARGRTLTLEVPVAAFEMALIENYSLLRNTLRVLGIALLEARGMMPAGPSSSRVADDGEYYTEARSLVELLIQLRQSPFGHMNLDALVDMARHMIEVRYPAGKLLWSAGESSTHALHIDAGRVCCTSANGREISLGRGFTLGVLDVWSGTRVYDARTETAVIAFRIDLESFLALLETHPEVGLDLLRGFARELLQARNAV